MPVLFDETGAETYIRDACSGECCLCAPNYGCCPENGDGYLPATKEEIIGRLDGGWYANPAYARTMKNYLLFQYNYNYDEEHSRS